MPLTPMYNTQSAKAFITALANLSEMPFFKMRPMLPPKTMAALLTKLPNKTTLSPPIAFFVYADHLIRMLACKLSTLQYRRSLSENQWTKGEGSISPRMQKDRHVRMAISSNVLILLY
jgi:hypothetical protein